MTKHFTNLDISEKTRKEYLYRIMRFLKFSDCIYDRDILIRYKQHLSKIDLKPSTKNKYLVVALVFLKQIKKDDESKSFIDTDIKLFKISNHHKNIGLTDEEVKKVFIYIDNEKSTRSKLRLSAIWHLMIYQGLRQIEIARMDTDHIDWTKGRFKVFGKGQDDWVWVTMHPDTDISINEYLNYVLFADGPLFRSESNKNKGSRISVMALQRMFRHGIFKILGINKTNHGSRHYYATEVIKKVGLSRAQEMTRHSNIKTIQIYHDEIYNDDEKRDILVDVFKH